MTINELHYALHSDRAMLFDNEGVPIQDEGWLADLITPFVAYIGNDLTLFIKDGIAIDTEDERDLQIIASKAGYRVTVTDHDITFEEVNPL